MFICMPSSRIPRAEFSRAGEEVDRGASFGHFAGAGPEILDGQIGRPTLTPSSGESENIRGASVMVGERKARFSTNFRKFIDFSDLPTPIFLDGIFTSSLPPSKFFLDILW